MTKQEATALIAGLYVEFTEEEKLKVLDEIERLKRNRESSEARLH